MKYYVGEKVWTPAIQEVEIVEFRELSVDCCDYGVTEPGYLVKWVEDEVYGKDKQIWKRNRTSEYLETELYEAPFHPILNQIKRIEQAISDGYTELVRLQELFDKHYPPEGTSGFD
jgi:hypothetical protein